MKKKFLVLGAVLSACVLSFTGNQATADERHPDLPSGGQKCYPGNPDCPNRIQSVADTSAPAAKKLQMDSVEKFEGTVTTVKREKYPDGRMFIHVMLDTKDGEKTFLIGPASFVDKSKVKLQVGDKVTIKGFRVGANGSEVIMAQSVDKNGNVLELLNEQRKPLWENGNGHNGNSH